MKILMAGDWHSDLHEEVAANALERLGHQVIRFAWCRYFPKDGASGLKKAHAMFRRAENKYLFGPDFQKLNADLTAIAAAEKPAAMFLYRGTHVTARTLRAIKDAHPEIVIVSYNNDNPFTQGHVPGLWRHYLAAAPLADLNLVYRHSNIEPLRQAGARRVELLRSWYVPERNHPVRLSAEEADRFASDVVFAGHYEPDHRVACLEEVARRGWKLRLFGHEDTWTRALQGSPLLKEVGPIRPVWGREYNLALAGAKIALCFFSKLNRDTYTRRCFEIPASGALMVSEFSEDLATLFEPQKEADYFSSPEDLGDKVDLYLRHEDLRARVALAGHLRVQKDEHDVVSRMRKVVGWIEELR